jgi:hypothetical protein
MKLKYLLPAGLALLLIILYIIPTTGRANITINAPMMSVYNQLNTPLAWKKWYAGAKDSASFHLQQQERRGFTLSISSASLQVNVINALTFGVTTQHITYYLSLTEQKYDKKTGITLDYETNLLSSFYPWEENRWLKKTALYNLKDYLESPSAYYGVSFIKVMTPERHMIVCKSVIKPVEIFEGIKKAVDIIRHTVPTRDLANKDNIFVQTSPAAGGLDLFVGVNVKQKPANDYPGLSYMHLYAMGALLVNYDGVYKNKRKIYTGMEGYLHDHGLKYTMLPIEIYRNDGLPADDTSRVKTDIIIPVR